MDSDDLAVLTKAAAYMLILVVLLFALAATAGLALSIFRLTGGI